MRLRRTSPYPTSGEICSSRRSLSNSSSRRLAGNKLDSLEKHPFQVLEVCRIIFGCVLLEHFQRYLSIINCGLNSGFWLLQVPGNGRYVSLRAVNQEDYIPDRQCSTLNVGLST